MSKREELETLLNCRESFKRSIKEYVEIFVEYYGEEERKYIEEKFNNIVLFPYQTDIGLNNTLRELENEITNELMDKLITNCGLDITREDLIEKNNFEYIDYSPISILTRYYNDLVLGEEKRKEKYYRENYESLKRRFPPITYEDFMEMVRTKVVPKKYGLSDKGEFILLEYTDISSYIRRFEGNREKSLILLNKIDKDITIENIDEKVIENKRIKKLIDDFERTLEEYKREKDKYKEYYEMRDKNKQLKEILSKKYYREYLESIVTYLPETLKENVEEYLYRDNIYLDHKKTSIIGTNNFNTILYEYFSEECEEKLNSETTPEWEKSRIKTRRKEYFNNLGYNYGEDYEEYEKHPEIFPNKETVSIILENYDRCREEYEKEYYTNSYPGIIAREQIKENNLLLINEVEMAKNIKERTISILTDIIREDNEYKLKPQIMINFDSLNEERDHFIIHELNHIFELSLNEVLGNQVLYTCGWDILVDPLGEEEVNFSDRREDRKYELFNEIINEKIAKEISMIMVDRGQEIFGKATEESYKYTTNYDNTNYLVDEFFKRYRKEIFLSRKNNNINIILEAVGKENFEELNELFHKHNERLGGMKFNFVVKDFNAKKDTEDTRYLQDLLVKRDEILKRMEEHYLSYKQSKNIML